METSASSPQKYWHCDRFYCKKLCSIDFVLFVFITTSALFFLFSLLFLPSLLPQTFLKHLPLTSFWLDLHTFHLSFPLHKMFGLFILLYRFIYSFIEMYLLFYIGLFIILYWVIYSFILIYLFFYIDLFFYIWFLII